MILRDEGKNDWLKRERGLSFELAAALILEGKYVAILRHARRPTQEIFLLPNHGYIHAVPFVIDGEGNLVLKTVFPSRTFNKKYGGTGNEGKT